MDRAREVTQKGKYQGEMKGILQKNKKGGYLEKIIT